jgi:hypothetical protein
MAARKDRSDSTTFQTEIMSTINKEIMPPDYVRVPEAAMPYWRDIIATKTEWSKVDLILAANLARCFQSIEGETFMLECEGSVIENFRGNPVMNPRHTVLEQLSRRAAALSQKLQVHSGATQGDPENNRKKNAVKRQAEELFDSLDDDDLIARPN